MLLHSMLYVMICDVIACYYGVSFLGKSFPKFSKKLQPNSESKSLAYSVVIISVLEFELNLRIFENPRNFAYVMIGRL